LIKKSLFELIDFRIWSCFHQFQLDY